MIKIIIYTGVWWLPFFSFAQMDSTKHEKIKIHHAEPLYIDLIRDLGARKGEREWNVGMGMTDKLHHDKYIALVEYEWAVADRLGLEIELPFSIHTTSGNEVPDKPSDKLESVKTAVQWTFLVSEKRRASLALGYINELELSTFDEMGRQSVISGNVFNPFLVAAKRVGTNWHTLSYAGIKVNQHFESRHQTVKTEINTSVHYMIPGSRNFVGVEFNKNFSTRGFEMVVRPQMRLVIHDSLMIGVVPGIPISKDNERLSSFLRLIYEPRGAKKH